MKVLLCLLFIAIATPAQADSVIPPEKRLIPQDVQQAFWSWLQEAKAECERTPDTPRCKDFHQNKERIRERNAKLREFCEEEPGHVDCIERKERFERRIELLKAHCETHAETDRCMKLRARLAERFEPPR